MLFKKKFFFTILISYIALTLILMRSAFCSDLNTPNPQEGFSAIVEKLIPAVVNISTKQKISFNRAKEKGWPSFPEGSPFEGFEDFLKRFGTPFGIDEGNQFESKRAISLGSGFLIDPAGYIVTNNGAVANSIANL